MLASVLQEMRAQYALIRQAGFEGIEVGSMTHDIANTSDRSDEDLAAPAAKPAWSRPEFVVLDIDETHGKIAPGVEFMITIGS
jgi:hypothetical protein